MTLLRVRWFFLFIRVDRYRFVVSRQGDFCHYGASFSFGPRDRRLDKVVTERRVIVRKNV